MFHNQDDIQPIVTYEDVDKYPYNQGLIYPYLFKFLLKFPSLSYKVFQQMKYFFFKIGVVFFYIKGNIEMSRVFLFFPWNITGGADKVNIEITQALQKYHPIVIFTDRIDKALLRDNYPEGIIKINLTQKYITYLHWFQQFFFAGYISAMINKVILKTDNNVVLLGSNCVLFYEILKHIHHPCAKVDVIHAWIGIEKHSISLVPDLTRRIIITPTLYPNLENQYHTTNNSQYLSRISVITNGVGIPDSIKDKPKNHVLNIIYVGRESPEKRTHIVGKIAKHSKSKNIDAQFKLIGVSSNAVQPEDLQFCSIVGEITNQEQLNSLYHSSDIILITSSFEGFPMVIMEGMAHGVIPISTNVGGVKDHIIDDETGYCVNNSTEEQIIDDMIERIEYLSKNPQKMHLIQLNAHNYAKSHFSVKIFREKYDLLVNNLLTA